MTDTTEYLNLEIEVAPNRSGRFEVRILDSPIDRPRGRFTPPCSKKKAIELRQRIETTVCRDIQGFAEPLDIEAIGTDLFQSLCPPELQETFEKCLKDGGEEGTGLRLRLSFDPSADKLAPFAALPWELSFHPASSQFLAQRKNTFFLRYVDVPVEIRRFFVPTTMRVLLIAPEPRDCHPTQGREEQRQVFQTLQDTPAVDVDCVTPPTHAALLRCLEDSETHVVHFIGHGGFNAEYAEGGLFFEDDEGLKDLVYGTDLAKELAGFSSLRLIMLNACRGAADRRKPKQVPFQGVASALIRNGLPAVVGMQFPIAIKTAPIFSGAFYQTLAATGHVDAAITQARHEVYSKGCGSREWITPVLLTRAANGRLFDPSTSPGPDEPLRVGIRSMFGWGVEIEDWSHAFLPLTSYFRGRYLVEGISWQAHVYPKLEQFLTRRVRLQKKAKKVHLDLAAHSSIAFATGHVLEIRAGIDMTLHQRSAAGTAEWRLDDEVPTEAGGWQIEEHELDGGQPDVALAISVAKPVLADVKNYVSKEALPVGRILEFRLPHGVDAIAVQNGAHAFRLAQAISNKMFEQPGDWDGTFHLFYAGPNGLFFFLGRLTRGPRRIQLYEYDFDGEGNRSYSPSLLFPPPTDRS